MHIDSRTEEEKRLDNLAFDLKYALRALVETAQGAGVDNERITETLEWVQLQTDCYPGP